MVQWRPQAKVVCSERLRKFLAELNCSQGRRVIEGRLARCDSENAITLIRQHWKLLEQSWDVLVDKGRTILARDWVMTKDFR